jgi:hypothetical protein
MKILTVSLSDESPVSKYNDFSLMIPISEEFAADRDQLAEYIETRVGTIVADWLRA